MALAVLTLVEQVEMILLLIQLLLKVEAVLEDLRETFHNLILEAVAQVLATNQTLATFQTREVFLVTQVMEIVVDDQAPLTVTVVAK